MLDILQPNTVLGETLFGAAIIGVGRGQYCCVLAYSVGTTVFFCVCELGADSQWF